MYADWYALPLSTSMSLKNRVLRLYQPPCFPELFEFTLAMPLCKNLSVCSFGQSTWRCQTMPMQGVFLSVPHRRNLAECRPLGHSQQNCEQTCIHDESWITGLPSVRTANLEGQALGGTRCENSFPKCPGKGASFSFWYLMAQHWRSACRCQFPFKQGPPKPRPKPSSSTGHCFGKRFGQQDRSWTLLVLALLVEAVDLRGQSGANHNDTPKTYVFFIENIWNIQKGTRGVPFWLFCLLEMLPGQRQHASFTF